MPAPVSVAPQAAVQAAGAPSTRSAAPILRTIGTQRYGFVDRSSGTEAAVAVGRVVGAGRTPRGLGTSFAVLAVPGGAAVSAGSAVASAVGAVDASADGVEVPVEGAEVPVEAVRGSDGALGTAAVAVARTLSA